MNARDLCAQFGISYHTYRARRRAGMSKVDALLTPPRLNRKYTPKQIALKRGDRFYEPATPCPKCGTSCRYAKSGRCWQCERQQRNAWRV